MQSDAVFLVGYSSYICKLRECLNSIRMENSGAVCDVFLIRDACAALCISHHASLEKNIFERIKVKSNHCFNKPKIP